MKTALRISLLILPFLLCFLGATIFPYPIQAQTTDSDEKLRNDYYIIMRHRSLVRAITCNCVSGNSAANRIENIPQASPTDDQLFFLFKTDFTEFVPPSISEDEAPRGVAIYIKNTRDGSCLDISKGEVGIVDVWFVVQKVCVRGKASQQWKLRYKDSSNDDHFYFLENVDHPEMGVSTQGFSTSEGTNLHLWNTNKTMWEQQWAFRKNESQTRDLPID